MKQHRNSLQLIDDPGGEPFVSIDISAPCHWDGSYCIARQFLEFVGGRLLVVLRLMGEVG
jgi:hypothetical protein